MTIVAPRMPNAGLKLPTDEGVLLVQGEDRPGLVRAISSALAENGANIVSLDQHTDDPLGGHPDCATTTERRFDDERTHDGH